jgi:glycosyltransferase involved in cell wall biosynthesis
MRVGIDASNLRAGGGLTHLSALLDAADPALDGFSRIVVWGGRDTLAHVPERTWIERVHVPALDGPLPRRILWQRTRLASAAHRASDILFIPGGTFSGSFRPFVTMCRNMLPFDRRERRRYGMSVVGLRLGMLEVLQARSFRRADGVIFLTDYAKRTVLAHTGPLPGLVTTIAHGVDETIRSAPRRQLPIGAYTFDKPFRLLYVSIVDLYKFQWTVADAVGQLRARGVPVTLDLIGPAYGPAKRKLDETLSRVDPDGKGIHYRGPATGDELRRAHHDADGFVFASTCENLPNILLAAMAAGLPLASSDRQPMPEIMGSDATYFDPEDVASIVAALSSFLQDESLRARSAASLFARSEEFSWALCARQTFAFLRDVLAVRGRDAVGATV